MAIKQLRDDNESFKKRIRYRLKKEPRKAFAIQERVFEDGYHLFYNGREFYSIGYCRLANQLILQEQLSSYLKYKVYQSKLPF